MNKNQGISITIIGILVITAGYFYINHSNKVTLINQVTIDSDIATTSSDSTKTQNTPNTINNWKTYDASDLGISFKYPSDWSVEKVPNNGRPGVVYGILTEIIPSQNQEIDRIIIGGVPYTGMAHSASDYYDIRTGVGASGSYSGQDFSISLQASTVGKAVFEKVIQSVSHK